MLLAFKQVEKQAYKKTHSLRHILFEVALTFRHVTSIIVRVNASKLFSLFYSTFKLENDQLFEDMRL